MNMSQELVRNMAGKAIAEHRTEVVRLCRLLGTTVDYVVSAWVVWDTGINEYDNSIYSSHAMRIAMHLHNLVPGNWHDERQKKVLALMRVLEPRKIVEVGFGTPQRYVADYVLRSISLISTSRVSISRRCAWIRKISIGASR